MKLFETTRGMKTWIKYLNFSMIPENTMMWIYGYTRTQRILHVVV